MHGRIILITGLLWPSHSRARTPAVRSRLDPTVAAVGDMACSPWNPDYNNGNGTATAAASSTSRTWS